MLVLRLLRQPVPLALWLGQLFSVTGDKLYGMAVLWLVLQLTGSAKLMAAVSAAESVCYVLAGLFGSGLIARSRRLPMMIRLDLLSAVVIALVPVSYLLGVRSVLLLIVVATAASLVAALFDPALQAALPEVVPAADLQPIVALTDSALAPIARLAKASVVVSTESPSFFHTMTPAFAAAEALAALLAADAGDEALSAIAAADRELLAVDAYVTPPRRRRAAR